MDLKKYLKLMNLTITDAAKQIGVTRPYLTEIANGLHGSRILARKIEDWSDGVVSHSEILYPEKRRKKK